MSAMTTVKRAVVTAGALTLLVCGGGQAQPGPKQPASHAESRAAGTSAQPSPAVRLLRPDGSVSSASVRIRPDAIPIQPNDSLDRVLNRNHLSSDPATVEAIRRQNPSIDLDQLHTHAGQHLYVPRTTGTTRPSGDHVLQIQDPNLARVQLRQDRKELVTLQQKTALHKDSLFTSSAVAARHQKTLKDVSLASQRLEAFTPSMSARDVALLNFQLSRVQHIADPTVRMHGETATQFTAARAATLDQSAQPMRSVLAVTARPGVNYEDLRREVKVVVSGPAGSRLRPQRVYALPAAMVERPSDYSDEVLLSLLRSLTFTNLTTPSSERFLFSDLAIWIGADDAYEAMLQRLRRGQLASRPVSIRESSPSVIELAFNVP
jgi:hypothetical protein